MRSIKILNLILGIVLVGTMLVVWVAFNPSGLSALAYVGRQQQMIRMLNTPMPVLGAATILLTLAAAFLRRANPARAVPLGVAALLLIGSGIITRFCNQPINAVVMTWNANAPPANWELLRDQWWTWHIVRTVMATVALGALLVGYGSSTGPAKARAKNA
jgi:hypothetical protein